MTVIGIYFGAQYACVGVWRDGRVEIIPNENSERTTRASLVFPESRGIDVVYEDVRMLLGSGGDALVTVRYNGEDQLFSPEQFCSMILRKMKQIAESYLRFEVREAVITLPAKLTNRQLEGTKAAASLAGLTVKKYTEEPVAAAIAYEYDKENYGHVLVVDIGASSLIVTLLSVLHGHLSVKAQMIDPCLGGNQFDKRVVDFLVKKFKEKHGENISKNSRASILLMNACESVKRTLSIAPRAEIMIQSLYKGIGFKYIMYRSTFESLNKDLFGDCVNVVKQLLMDGRMDQSNSFEVVLVGGLTTFPMLHKLLKRCHGERDIPIRNSINSDEVVAYGAAVQAAILNNDLAPRNLFRIQSLLKAFTANDYISSTRLLDYDIHDEDAVNSLRVAKQIPINFSFEITAVNKLRIHHGFDGEVILGGSESSYRKLFSEAQDAGLRVASDKLPAELRAPLDASLAAQT